MKNWNRVLALLLAVMLCVSLLPLGVLADEEDSTEVDDAVDLTSAEEESSEALIEDTLNISSETEESDSETTIPEENETSVSAAAEPAAAAASDVELAEEEGHTMTTEEASAPEETAADDLAVDGAASATCGDDLSWTLSDDGVLTISGDGAMYNYTYSSSAPWQSNSSSITSVVIGSGVTSIGNYAFYYCTSLAEITIPEGVTSIGNSAFNGCSGLTSITLPDSVTSIGSWAFEYCSSLTSITLPEGVTSIGNSAFEYCSSLTSITLPEGVTSIGNCAFEFCSSLTSITLPEGVTSIGNCAFYYCSSLTSISVAEDNAYYSSKDGVLFNKSQTELIACPGGKSGSYAIPASVTSIGEDAFFCCSSLTSVTIPDSVTSIGEDAFRGCRGLTSITLPDSVTSIGEDAFLECRGLASITIPESVTSIENYAFWGCSSLTSITLPEGVTSIGACAFEYCSSLTSITIPESVTSIGNSAFEYCSSLTSITIPASVTSIGNSAFYGCSALTNITLPEGVTSIGSWAFEYCSSLTSITIPASVTSIENYAFYGCSALTDVYYAGSEEDWAAITIGSGNSSLTSDTTTIHYNYAGDMDATQPVVTELYFDESGLQFDISSLVEPDHEQDTMWRIMTEDYTESDASVQIVQAICTCEGPLELCDIKWEYDDELLSFSDTDIYLDYRIPKGDGTFVYCYWVSAAVQAGMTGEGSIVLTISGVSADIAYEIIDSSVCEHLEIGTLTWVDENLKYVGIDDVAYTVSSRDYEYAKEILNNKKISDKRVIYQYDDLHAISRISSIYDVLEPKIIWNKTNPTTLTYENGYTDNPLSVSFSLIVGIKVASRFKDGDLAKLTSTELYLTLDKFSVQSYDKNVVYFGETPIMGTKREKATEDYLPEVSGTKLYYDKESAQYTIKADLGEDAPSTTDFQKLFEVFVSLQEDKRSAIDLGYYSVALVDKTEQLKVNAMSDLYSGLDQSFTYTPLTTIGGYTFDSDTVTAMAYIIHAYAIDTFMSYNKASTWEEKLADKITGSIKSAVLKKLKISKSTVGSYETLTINPQIIADDTEGKKRTVDFTITMGILNDSLAGEYEVYAGENKDVFAVGTTVDWDAVAKYMMSYVEIAYNKAWGKSADDCMRIIMGKPLESLFDYAKKINKLSSYLDLKIEKLPTSSSNAIFKIIKNAAGNYKVGTGHCPVDVYVYNDAGVLSGAIVNNKKVTDLCEDDNVQLWVDGDDKNFILYDDDYSVVFVGTDKGTMDYEVKEYENNCLVRTVKMEDIPLETDKVYWGELPSELYVDAKVYALLGDAEETIAIAGDIYSGTKSENVTWTLEEGVLTVSGTGAMTDYSSGDAPWDSEKVTSVVIEEGVTSIGSNVFAGCASLEEITFKGTAPDFGEDVFAGVTATAYYPEGDDTWTEDVMQDYGGTITWEAVSFQVPGDVDGDGEVTGFDASLVLQYEVGLIDESGLDLSVADVDGDGEVTGFDASLILQYEVGLIDSF